MSKVFVGLVLTAIQSIAGGPSPALKPALRLVLSPDRIEVTSNDRFTLSLAVTNLSENEVTCAAIMDGNLDVSYSYDIRRENGERVTRVQRHYLGIVSGCQLRPGSTIDKSIYGLMSAYGMQKPGVYTVQVSRADPIHPKELVDSSNIVKIVVKASR